MRVKAKVIVDVVKMEVSSISFETGVLNSSNTPVGKVRLKKFINKRIMSTPLREFEPYEGLFKDKKKCLMSTVIDMDVYPYIWKKAILKEGDNPYACELFPYPVTRENAASFEEYSDYQTVYLKSLMMEMAGR